MLCAPVPTTSIAIPSHLSSSQSLISSSQFSIPIRTTITLNNGGFPSLTIRMGGGPRTFPGGVSKWQWKRMQAKKAKQLLKARLCRERQIYEMRKRAELKSAISELERPWEVVQRAPNLFSIKADEQVKVLADRFQKPGGFDMWSEGDGPVVFQSIDDVPSARFFPKGAVHSLKPYGLVGGKEGESGGEQEIGRSTVGRRGNGSRRMRDVLDSWNGEKNGDKGFSGGSRGNKGDTNRSVSSQRNVSRTPSQGRNGAKAESFDPLSLRSKADGKFKVRNFNEAPRSDNVNSGENCKFDSKANMGRSGGRIDSRNQNTMQQRNRSKPSNSLHNRNHNNDHVPRERVKKETSEDGNHGSSKPSNSWRLSNNHDGNRRTKEDQNNPTITSPSSTRNFEDLKTI